jgi:O-antigen ligase
MLQNKTVNVLFFLMIATLPFVNKVSKFTVVLFLIIFFKFVYEYKDFILPRTHKIFLYTFLLLIILSNFLADKMLYNLKKDFYLLTFILIYIAVNYFIEKKILKISTLIYAIVIPMTIYMIDGYYQYYTGFDLFFHHSLQLGGVGGVSNNRNIFALAVFFYFVTLFYLSVESKKKSSLVYFLLVLSFILIFLTLSRQIWISAFVFILIIALFKYRSFSVKYIILIFLGISILFTILAFFPSVQQRFLDLEHMSSAARVEFWNLLIPHIFDKPWLGHSMQSPMNIENASTAFRYAHNLTLDVLYDFGLTGFILYLGFIGYFLKQLLTCNSQRLKPYLFAIFIVLIFIQQQVGGSMLIHKFIGPSIMIFLALITTSCSKDSFVKK